MFEAAVLLSHTKKLRTDGVAAALQSGGACTLFAEAAGAAGLPLPEFSRATKTALKKALPSFASQNNPLDVTGQAAVETDMFVDALSALASDPASGSWRSTRSRLACRARRRGRTRCCPGRSSCSARRVWRSCRCA